MEKKLKNLLGKSNLAECLLFLCKRKKGNLKLIFEFINLKAMDAIESFEQ
jgi:hypothetical protein